MYISTIVVITMLLAGTPLTAFASIVDYEDEPEEQEICEEKSDYTMAVTNEKCDGLTVLFV